MSRAATAPTDFNIAVDPARDERAERLQRKLLRELGPTVIEALNDPTVVEICLNPDGALWVERLGQAMVRAGTLPAMAAEALISTIATCLNTSVTPEHPIVEGELSLDGSRFEGLIPPVVCAPTWAIRRRASSVFTLEDYVRQGVMDDGERSVIERALRERQNLLVVGGTGSGKTTLVNALIDAIARSHPDHRLVIVEDTAELQCAAPNAVRLHTTQTVDMTRLVRATMRLRPDRIIVGEVRGGEALALLKAWNTGHPGGVATVHANSAHAGLTRLEQLIAEATQRPMQALIAEAVDWVIMIEKTARGRRLREIIRVAGYQDGRYLTRTISTLKTREVPLP
jgi:P-type conjugative transfer ATPase TrbB